MRQQNQKKSKRLSTFDTLCGHTLDLSMLHLSLVLWVSQMALSTCLSLCSLTVSVNTDCKHPRGSLSSLLTLPITGQSALFHVLIFTRTLSACHSEKSSPLTRSFQACKKVWFLFITMCYEEHVTQPQLCVWQSSSPQSPSDVMMCVTASTEPQSGVTAEFL